MKMWSGRFRQPLDEKFERWQRSFPFDCILIHYELAASRAHTRALALCGAISDAERETILSGLSQIADRAKSIASFFADPDAEDVHHFVEKQLVTLIGDTGYKLHSGRSRNEQIATDLRLYVRDSIDTLQGLFADWMGAILDRAKQAGEAAMPAYTHMQRAEPVLVAHWLLAYIEMFLRDASRLSDCRKRLNLCPLGSGAVAGATLPLDRAEMAAELYFDAPTGNSIDATSDRDFVLEFVSALSQTALHLSRWAEEMLLFSTQEYAFVSLPEPYSTGSSAMPQKKNGDLLELVRAKAARIIGNQNALLVTIKGLPLAYNKDLQETQQPLFESTRTMLTMLPLVTGFMRSVEFHLESMQKAAQSGFMNAWAAATYLVRLGIPSRLAHEQVGKAVRLCMEKKCALEDLSLGQWRAINPTISKDIYKELTLPAVLAMHDVVGGTAPVRVVSAIQEARRRVDEIRAEAPVPTVA
ncbi:MAG TPA: argininosuccinate lyase [Terriglobales bacterium]|jgi:argininosuccinate lyase|nr:argininosuccinate lyase [Terriglobales bacterium]